MVKKVLVVNKYHFVSGGAERYFLSVMDAMRRRGIEAIPLSVNYAKTVPTPYARYFVEPVGSREDAKIQNSRPGVLDRMRLARRAVYNLEAKEAVKRICRDHRPDVCYVLNINNHLSPSVIDGAWECGMPVVMRMSDFNLVCSSNMYFRDGHPCTDCKGGLHHAVIHRCVHGSALKSCAAVFAKAVHRWAGIYRKVSAFVTPSHFMKRDLCEQGFPESRVHQINTFVKPHGRSEPDAENPYILYVGRFAEYKGAGIALEAFARSRSRSRVEFRLLGDEGDADAAALKAKAAALGCPNVRFLPFERDKSEVVRQIGGALFTLVPSINYENLPHTLIESFACGRPVVSTRFGSIPETVRDGENGLLYAFGDAADFASKIDYLAENADERERMGAEAYRDVIENHSEERHMERLLGLFDSLTVRIDVPQEQFA